MPLDNTDPARFGQALSRAICTDLSDLLGNCSGQNNAGDTPVTVPNNSGRNIFPLDATNLNLIAAGASIHWLVAGQKRPVAADWSAAPVETESSLRAHYRENANIGIRLGQPSRIGGDYLHLIDLDVRDPSKAAEAWGALLAIWPDAKAFPSVVSGSGGESRHLYFLTSKPFRKAKIAKSTGFSMVFDASKNREVKKNDWEIDLMGTGSQAVLPPSIHPDTGLPYRWERPVDLTFTLSMWVNAERVAGFGARLDTGSDDEGDVDDDDLLAIVAGAPMDLTAAQVREIIAGLPAEWVDDRDNWLTVGAALHHQFEGSREGFDLWCDWSKASLKFDLKDAKRVWKSFRGSKKPVRMATLIKATRREWHGKLEFDEAKRLLNSDMNILTILRNDPIIAGKFNFNEFTGNVELSDKLSILDQVIESERLSDLHIVAIKTWLSRVRTRCRVIART